MSIDQCLNDSFLILKMVEVEIALWKKKKKKTDVQVLCQHAFV